MQNHIKQTASYFKNLVSNYSQACRISAWVIFATLSLSTAELNAQNIEMQNSTEKQTHEKTLERSKEEKRERNGVNTTELLIASLESKEESETIKQLNNLKSNWFSSISIYSWTQPQGITININTADALQKLQTLEKIYWSFELETSTAYWDFVEIYIKTNKEQVYENINNELKSIDSELKKLEEKTIENKKKAGEHYIQQLIRNDGQIPNDDATHQLLDLLNKTGFGEIKVSIDNDSSKIITTKDPDKNTIRTLQDLCYRFSSKDIITDSLTIKDIEDKNGRIEVKVEERTPEETPIVNSSNSLDYEKEDISNYDISPYYLEFMRATKVDKANNVGKRDTKECQAIVDSISKAFNESKLTWELFAKKQTEYDNCVDWGSE